VPESNKLLKVNSRNEGREDEELMRKDGYKVYEESSRGKIKVA